jgi:hypothetical protein
LNGPIHADNWSLSCYIYGVGNQLSFFGRAHHPWRLIFVIGLALPFGLPAQESDSDRPLGVEELYLNTLISVEVVADQIEHGSEEVQMLALQSVEAGLAAGALDPRDEDLFLAIEPLLDRGVTVIRSNPNRTYEAYNPFVRVEAVRVTAMLGTDRARRKLISIALSDPEPQVRVESLYGLAAIARDPDGETTRSIARVLFQERADQPHQPTTYAALIAVSAIADDPANVIHESVREEIVKVASDFRYAELVRRQALVVLAKL